MPLSDAIRQEHIRKASILFIDDKLEELDRFIQQVGKEGFKNLRKMPQLESFDSLMAENPAVLVLDLAGVASELDSTHDGLSILEYSKDRLPFTRVIVFSGTTLDVNQSRKLSRADVVLKKGNVSLKDFVCQIEDQVVAYFDPRQQRKIFLELVEQHMFLDRVDGKFRKWRIRRILNRIANYSEEEIGESFYEDLEKLLPKVKTIIEWAMAIQWLLKLGKP